MTAESVDVQRRVLRADDPVLGPWQAFLRAHARVTRRLDEDLRANHGMSLAEYDALFQLSQAPERRLRMSKLADQVLLSRSGVTRLIDRLVENGSVERGHVPMTPVAPRRCLRGPASTACAPPRGPTSPGSSGGSSSWSSRATCRRWTAPSAGWSTPSTPRPSVRMRPP